MDGFDQNVNVKVSSVFLSKEAFNFPSVTALFLLEHCAVTVTALATSPLCLVLVHSSLAEVLRKVYVHSWFLATSDEQMQLRLVQVKQLALALLAC